MIVNNPTTELQLGTTTHKHELVLNVLDLFGHLQGAARGGRATCIYIILPNYSSTVGIYIKTCLTASKMNSFKLQHILAK